MTHSFRNESALDEQPSFITGRVASVAGDVLNLTGMDDFQLSRLRPAQGSPLKGGWMIGESGEQAFVAFTEGRYFIAEHAEAGEGGMSGIELGSYEYDLASQEVLFETLVDLNGEWGFSHPCAVQGLPDPGDLNCGPNGAVIKQTLTVDGDTLIFVSEADTVAEGEEQPIELQRVGH